ncbi:MAG: stage II sporulation protein M [bacterium]|nr:stage II sporulation protein M [bacterium]
MILDLQKFIAGEKPYWNELDTLLTQLERDAFGNMELGQVKRFHYLYQRTSADLAKVSGFSAETEIRRYLESLVARAYAEIHEVRGKQQRFNPLSWFFSTFPQTFRRHVRAFWLSAAVTMAGLLFGAALISIDADAKNVLMPFPHLKGAPSERVALEEEAEEDRLSGQKSSFSAYLMTHNTRVSIFTFALGMTWGIGTMVMLFYNGIILGSVIADYLLAGESAFLAGWLLPHGVVEIPAILLAGQAGLVLAGALIGWGERMSLKSRLKHVGDDLVTLLFGLALMLIWAGFVEAFLSQYHEPVIPYSVKIGFGVVELIALSLFFGFSGRTRDEEH